MQLRFTGIRGLVLIVLAAMLLVLPASEAGAQQRCNGYVDLCSRPFSETVFAATHNSASADAYGWSSTITNQTGGIRRQLDDGIRAINLDVHYAKPGLFGSINNADGPTGGGVEPYLCHGVCVLGSLRLTLGLTAIGDFLAANPNEVVVVLLEDHVSVEDFTRDLQATNLWPYVYDGPLTRTLGEMIAMNRRVVVIAENQSSTYPWFHRLTTVGRDTEYSFRFPSELTSPANLWNSCRPTARSAAARGRILLMQHFITPATSGLRAAAAIVNQRSAIVNRARTCATRHGVLPSIVMVDYYEYGDVNGAVRALNDLYVAPLAGAAPTCADITTCGLDPARPNPAGDAVGAATSTSSSTQAGLSRLRLRPLAPRAIVAGSSVRLTISVRNTSETAAVLPVTLSASRRRGLTLPAPIRIRVPANSTATRTVVIGISAAARTGSVRIAVQGHGLTAATSLRIIARSSTISAVTG